MKLLDLIARWSLPTPSRQHMPQLPSGRRYIDCALPAYRIAIEYDGRHHLTDAQRHDDQMRDEALRRLGWVTIRVSGRRLRDERRLVADIWANVTEQAQRFGREPPAPPCERAG
jgi:very-short-patch-repair endonuclease